MFFFNFIFCITTGSMGSVGAYTDTLTQRHTQTHTDTDSTVHFDGYTVTLTFHTNHSISQSFQWMVQSIRFHFHSTFAKQKKKNLTHFVSDFFSSLERLCLLPCVCVCFICRCQIALNTANRVLNVQCYSVAVIQLYWISTREKKITKTKLYTFLNGDANGMRICFALKRKK